jgi:hypothetical protein
MDWKHLLAYITGTVDQELLWRNEYLVTENRILRDRSCTWSLRINTPGSPTDRHRGKKA